MIGTTPIEPSTGNLFLPSLDHTQAQPIESLLDTRVEVLCHVHPYTPTKVQPMHTSFVGDLIIILKSYACACIPVVLAMPYIISLND